MGRPKGSKNKSTQFLTKELINRVETEPNIIEEIKEAPVLEAVSAIPASRKKEIIYTCSLCGKQVKYSLNNINLIQLTGRATWHRDVNIDRISICNECSEELNSVVDKFILKKNPSLNKWSISNG